MAYGDGWMELQFGFGWTGMIGIDGIEGRRIGLDHILVGRNLRALHLELK